jgi:tetratricopeptide (TPR) repeat protein
VFTSTTSTLLGKWYDLGIYAGLIFLLTFFTLNILNKKGIIKVSMWILFIISAFFLLIINSTMIWSMIAIVLLGYSFYFYSNKEGNGAGVGRFFSRVSIATTILLIISIVLALQGNIASPLVKSLNLSNFEISLPWQLALDVTTDTIKQKPLFGAGPNRFTSEFLLNKPQILNPSDFWNIEFSTGFGFIPSFIVTQGMVGIVLWILFLLFFVALGAKTLKQKYELGKNYPAVSSFFISSFLWLVLIVYNPSHVMLFITFIMTGIFIAIACSEKIVPIKNYSKLMIIIASIMIIVSVIWAFVYVKKTVAFAYFQSGISILRTDQAGDIDKIENSFKNALKWDESDIYYQALSELTILKINDLAQKIQAMDQKSVDQEMVKQVGIYIEEAVAYTNKAIEIDPTNYYNHVSLARISEIAFSLKITNAFENAKMAYTNALSLNPYNPALYLNLARLEASNNNLVDAQKYIGTALQLKQNYIEAIFLLSQIQVSQGQIKNAITSVQVATQINPNDPLLFFQLGLLHYNDKNYQGAIDALTKATTLDSQYANAQYFLGLSYARLNKNIEAIDIFEGLAASNPDNEELVFILSNLKANKSPFADVQPPADSKPETRKTLPVKEKTVESTKTKKAI